MRCDSMGRPPPGQRAQGHAGAAEVGCECADAGGIDWGDPENKTQSAILWERTDFDKSRPKAVNISRGMPNTCPESIKLGPESNNFAPNLTNMD